MRIAEASYEKTWAHCDDCRCARPIRELVLVQMPDESKLLMCRDRDWCRQASRHYQEAAEP